MSRIQTMKSASLQSAPSVGGEIVVLVYTERQEDVIRIVSARRASTREAALFHRYYEETNQ